MYVRVDVHVLEKNTINKKRKKWSKIEKRAKKRDKQRETERRELEERECLS
jgi:hypothetical protein